MYCKSSTCLVLLCMCVYVCINVEKPKPNKMLLLSIFVPHFVESIYYSSTHILVVQQQRKMTKICVVCVYKNCIGGNVVCLSVCVCVCMCENENNDESSKMKEL